MKGFWNSLVACLDDLQQKGVIRGEWHNSIKVVDTLEELTLVLKDSCC
jgi:predicted Rossmann-fold nucleotide-binding protein